MSHFYISINQFAEYSTATPKRKERILEQQITPNKFLIPWYQAAKGGIKRYLHDINSDEPIKEAIVKISKKKPENKRQITDKTVSLEALKALLNLHLESHFEGLEYEVIKIETKSVLVNNVEIGISPELIFKTVVRGKTVYGGVKIHISKTKPFSLNQCQSVSAMLKRYIEKNIVKSGEFVNPKLCLCVDIFGGRIVAAKLNDDSSLEEARKICNEIKKNWPK